MNWSEAKSYCETLDLGGYSDWVLPSISELRSIIRGCSGTVIGGACPATDSCLSYFGGCWDDETCGACTWNAGPAEGCYWADELQGTCSVYWSSSLVQNVDSDLAWFVDFSTGKLDATNGLQEINVRCAR